MPLQCPIKPGKFSSYILQREGKKEVCGMCRQEIGEYCYFSRVRLASNIFQVASTKGERERERTRHCTSSAMIAIKDDPREDACAATPAMTIDVVCDSRRSGRFERWKSKTLELLRERSSSWGLGLALQPSPRRVYTHQDTLYGHAMCLVG